MSYPVLANNVLNIILYTQSGNPWLLCIGTPKLIGAFMENQVIIGLLFFNVFWLDEQHLTVECVFFNHFEPATFVKCDHIAAAVGVSHQR